MAAWLWILGPMVLSNVVLVAAEVSSRRAKYSGRVINGEDANIADFPFYGALAPKRSIFVDREKTHLAIICGSTLIAPSYFITAYHCFLKHSDPMYWVIIMGVTDRCNYDGKGTVVDVAWIYKHPQAKISSNVKMNDIALVVVAQPITNVVPLALPLEPPQTNEKGYIVGFGLSKITSPEGNISDMSCKPQKALQYVPDQRTCIKPKENIIGAFCIKDVHNREAAACRGDSGGPYLVLRNGKRTLLGISSFGDKLCRPSANSDHYTNVFSFMQWVNKMLHEPLPEGFKRMRLNAQLFKPAGQHVNGNDIPRMVSTKLNANSLLMYEQPVLSVNAIDASGPGPELLGEMSADESRSSSVEIVGNPQPKQGSSQQFHTGYMQQQVSGRDSGHWGILYPPPPNPNMVRLAGIPDNMVPSNFQNDVARYEAMMTPARRSFQEAHQMYNGMASNLPQGHIKSKSFSFPLTRI